MGIPYFVKSIKSYPTWFSCSLVREKDIGFDRTPALHHHLLPSDGNGDVDDDLDGDEDENDYNENVTYA